LRTRAALEKTALDQKAIGALSFDHGDPGVRARCESGAAMHGQQHYSGFD
jgi:hypothetical protein